MISSKKLIEMLEADGWVLDRITKHYHFKHPKKANLISVPHPRKDLPTGTAKKIMKDAGLK